MSSPAVVEARLKISISVAHSKGTPWGAGPGFKLYLPHPEFNYA